MKRIIGTFCFACIAIAAGASIKMGDLYYELDANKLTAQVTYQSWDGDNYPGLTSVNIPASVTYNNITYMVTAIGEYAFRQCPDLVTISIPASVTELGFRAFSECSLLKSIAIPQGVKTIPESAFEGCYGLTDVSIPSSVISIQMDAFYYCFGLTSVTVPSGVTSIGTTAFEHVPNVAYSGPATNYYPWGARSINGYVENQLVYSDNTKTTLLACPSTLDRVFVPEGVSALGKEAFLCCFALQEVAIPQSVTNIGEFAFVSCKNLQSITNYAATPQNVSKSVFGQLNNFQRVDFSTCVLYVPQDALTLYKSAQGWKEFAHIEPIPMQEDLNQISTDPLTATRKLLHNGQILILRGDKTYTVTGQEVK